MKDRNKRRKPNPELESESLANNTCNMLEILPREVAVLGLDLLDDKDLRTASSVNLYLSIVCEQIYRERCGRLPWDSSNDHLLKYMLRQEKFSEKLKYHYIYSLPTDLEPRCDEELSSFNLLKEGHRIEMTVNFPKFLVLSANKPFRFFGRATEEKTGIFYVEFKILELNNTRNNGMAIGMSGRLNSRLPGWEPDLGSNESYGYHSDDGTSRYNTNNLEELKGDDDVYGPVYGIGDTVGMIINRDLRQISYTKNGKYLGPAFLGIDLDSSHSYASVGFVGRCNVEYNFGEKPFMYIFESGNGLQ
eukprot:TRINITY_DN22661_c0_g1_i1.p1 TRINITY_DN22661_c0_g1~~TRINITY_DN22661_c0_g1_i1.p1  ORF type:complete len:304 (-),score=25.28 TRINITY_DN22661_c0_g1_i1:196-1107(-)